MNFHSATSHWVFPGTVRIHRKKLANLKMKSFDLGFVRRRVAIMSQQAHKGFHMVCDPSSSLLIHHHALWHTSQRGFAFLHSIVLVCWISSRCFRNIVWITQSIRGTCNWLREACVNNPSKSTSCGDLSWEKEPLFSTSAINWLVCTSLIWMAWSIWI